VTGDRTSADVNTWEQLAAALGAPLAGVPAHRWVQSATAGHVGAVVSATRPELVFVHDIGDDAHAFDAVSIALGRPAVSIDLPGHGRSSSAGIVEPALRVNGLLDAILSFAPQALAVVASGYGAAIALRAAVRRPSSVPALLIIDGSPYSSRITPLSPVPTGAGVDGAAAVLGDRAPGRLAEFRRHLAVHSTIVDADGDVAWRSQVSIPDGFDDWLTFDDVDGDLPIPVTVVTGATGVPVDRTARAALRRWPSVDRIRLGVGPLDLLGASPVEVAAAIERVLRGGQESIAERASSDDVRAAS
jgi:pimeloyl-ACP methyl ester carboxylesterase